MEHLWLERAVIGAYLLLSLLLLLRFGLLAFTVANVSWHLLTELPVTTDLSAWYAHTGATAMLVVLGLSVYGFAVSLGEQTLFRTGALADN